MDAELDRGRIDNLMILRLQLDLREFESVEMRSMVGHRKAP